MGPACWAGGRPPSPSEGGDPPVVTRSGDPPDARRGGAPKGREGVIAQGPEGLVEKTLIRIPGGAIFFFVGGVDVHVHVHETRLFTFAARRTTSGPVETPRRAQKAGVNTAARKYYDVIS